MRLEEQDLFVELGKGSALMDVAHEIDLPITFGCGQGVCGSCKVEVLEAEHLAPPDESEVDFLERLNAGKSERLACQIRLVPGEDQTLPVVADILLPEPTLHPHARMVRKDRKGPELDHAPEEHPPKNRHHRQSR